MSLFSRRWTVSAVLVSYLLAATFAGMFHNHGGNCCTELACSLAAATVDAANAPMADAGCHHHHGHRHSHDAAGQNSDIGTSSHSHNSPERQPHRHNPLHDPGCAACQFLAQQSVAAPRCELQSTGTLVHPVPDAVEICGPAVVADAHPARGPPCRA